MSDNPELLKLCSLTDGLLWMSEAEYPFEVFVWNDLTSITPEELRSRTGHSLDVPVEVIDFEKFFKPAVTVQEWHNEEEKAEVKRYQELLSFLKDNLENVKVYRVGETEIDVYIIGQCSGQLIGLKTKVIET